MISPEIYMPVEVAELLTIKAKQHALEDIEAELLAGLDSLFGLDEMPAWNKFVDNLRRTWLVFDHAIVRGGPVGDGSTTLLTSLALGMQFKFYRNDKIVKHFKMSPWTTDLSHTMREGHFHTDLNTTQTPPKATVIHCLKPDPDVNSGVIRVARVLDLLEEARRTGDESTLRFLCETKVEMVDKNAHDSWSGYILTDDTIRFHPETLRDAQCRSGSMPQDLEFQLSKIHQIAMAVSTPILLEEGDAVFVSNVRALHYRGPCTVNFLDFPRSFDAREIYVLHLLDEPECLE